MPAKNGLLERFQAEVAGKDEPQLRRMIDESEDIAEQRESTRNKLTLLRKAAREVATFM